MPSSVSEAFHIFLEEVVLPDPEDTRQARTSRDLLLAQLHQIPDDGSPFPALISDRHLSYGAFARGTGIRPLDDLDLMICLHGAGSTFRQIHSRVEISVAPEADKLKPFCFTGTCLLDSRRILAAFATFLARIPGFREGEIKRTGEAVSLKVEGLAWHFDLMPSFCMKEGEGEGRNFLLMPDRYGHWRKTDPAMDNKRVAQVTEQHGSHVLTLIQLLKYWQRQFAMLDFTSYLLECIVLDYFGQAAAPVSPVPDVALPYLFHYLSGAILPDVPDPKGLKRTINHLGLEERRLISERAALDSLRAIRARELERDRLAQASIQKWQEIFGKRFPSREVG